MSSRVPPEVIEEVKEFHGHWCPGLAIGIRAAELALLRFEPENDEDLVCVAESDFCAVDAIQYLNGCTMGKGNLIIKDWGKRAFTFFDRRNGEGFRALLQPGSAGDAMDTFRKEVTRQEREGASEEERHALHHMREDAGLEYLNMDLDAMFDVQAPRLSMPRDAQVLASMVCAHCGEQIMESRARLLAGDTLCIPCFEARDQKC